ncbi:MAG: dienelactone hydrolase family protein [Alphaproteobacteria bacterium]|nr:dienelactone hydrolase family protein [Alphaproteobacteria bacterium]
MRQILRIFFFAIILLHSSICQALDVIAHIPETPKKALIMLHGWHHDGAGVQWLTNVLKNDFPDMAFYYPTAPDNAPSGGYQWFEIPTLGSSMSQEKMYDIMMHSALGNLEHLYNLIDNIHETQQIEYENIYIAGFSQGGFMAILTGLTNNKPIGKVISFSGVPILLTKDFKKTDVVSSPEIIIIQGDSDYVIPNDSYNLTRNTLNSLNIKSSLKVIKNMPHTINDEALNYAIEFMKN